jgi:hypothetical protein
MEVVFNVITMGLLTRTVNQVLTLRMRPSVLANFIPTTLCIKQYRRTRLEILKLSHMWTYRQIVNNKIMLKSIHIHIYKLA